MSKKKNIKKAESYEPSVKATENSSYTFINEPISEWPQWTVPQKNSQSPSLAKKPMRFRRGDFIPSYSRTFIPPPYPLSKSPLDVKLPVNSPQVDSNAVKQQQENLLKSSQKNKPKVEVPDHSEEETTTIKKTKRIYHLRNRKKKTSKE